MNADKNSDKNAGVNSDPNEDCGALAPGAPADQLPVRMRGPADMAEMLPYLLGFFPDDSIVAVGLHGPALQQGGVIRVDIPDDPECWQPLAAETARLLIALSEQRDRRPEQVLLYVCRDPADGDGRAVVTGLAPLADQLAQAFRAEGVKVKESLCISAGRWWSFLCAGTGCCRPEGALIRSAHLPSPAAAAATFAGLAPRGSRKAIAAALAPIGLPGADAQRAAIERAGPRLLGELTGPGGRPAVLERTSALIEEAMAEFGTGAGELDPERAARLLVGLQDRLGRDRGAEYAEPEELIPAQRLWRYLAQRCVPPFEHFGAAPLTLLAWTSWLAADTATARIVLARALDLDPEYTLAQLLYDSLNGGLMPDQLLESVRRERSRRLPPAAGYLSPARSEQDRSGSGRPGSGGGSACPSSVGHVPPPHREPVEVDREPADDIAEPADDVAGADPEGPIPARRGLLRRRAERARRRIGGGRGLNSGLNSGLKNGPTSGSTTGLKNGLKNGLASDLTGEPT
ncbi:DUF4192 domain-containing protein [Kitasatospora sp. MAP5-34]|uniref:DUF4192 domain-containing protein n=1 Tax=Kitasatospora sp. MAP5-34 TaxID=3035102 RepID=UPI002475DA84|nr:DUF4192 domain-containing protein [Kitasatospora sp. MAP5-34]